VPGQGVAVLLLPAIIEPQPHCIISGGASSRAERGARELFLVYQVPVCVDAEVRRLGCEIEVGLAIDSESAMRTRAKCTSRPCRFHRARRRGTQ
jgi:hypothetical protein